MYRVIRFFTDLKDNNHAYNVGDIFPRMGVDASEERLEELSGSNNKQHAPLIQKIEEPKREPVEPVEERRIEERQSRRRKKG